jgi:Ring finger domain
MDDIEIAIALQLNEADIYDETLINQVIGQYRHGRKYDLDEIMDDTFYTNEKNVNQDSQEDPIGLEDYLEYISDSGTYKENLNRLMFIRNQDFFELVNLNAQQELQNQFNTQQFQSPFGPLHNMINSLFGNVNQPPGFVFQYPPMNPVNLGAVDFNLPINIGSENNQFATFLNAIINPLGPRVAVTLTDDALSKLKEMTYDEVKMELPNISQEEACSICFLKLTENEEKFKYIILECKHVFHSECINEHLTKYDYHCPICREECGEHIARI